MAIVVGVAREFITREQGVERLEKITHFLSNADRFHGVWPHFLDWRTGKVIPCFGQYDDGGNRVPDARLAGGAAIFQSRHAAGLANYVQPSRAFGKRWSGTGIATGRTRIFFTGTGRPTPVSRFITG